MMKKILLIAIVALLAVSCNDNIADNNTVVKETINNGSKNSIQSEAQLEGTKWKLIGFYDVGKNKLREVEPKNCEKCFTLEFYTDSNAYGYSIFNSVNINIKTWEFFMTDIYESDGDGTMYTDILSTVKSYSYEEDILKFYYNNKKNYLLYVLINDNKEEE